MTGNLDAARAEGYPLRRREVVAALLAERGDLLVVAGLGAPVWDTTAAGDHPLNFPLWGAMGGAAAMGLGLAMARPDRRVLVITGDGEMLMGLGALSTIGAQRPENLSIVVCDNERYGETGMQLTHTAGTIDLPTIAVAAGFAGADTIRSDNEFKAALPIIREAPGPLFHSIKVRAEDLPFAMPPKDGVTLKDRFRDALQQR
ncbi:MAG: thiamine pyrophosphate-dependent enzyme [Alphaproteobacteria bacterium]|jgi:thiamine pyrophosphate-dependent acetolactate synthase large subunit-like protein|nr:thiamine pyrophosphate-dependent enzyme [Alphaproteobacteria bacterium]MDP6812427.1 thiamine pyrophosphate-dependent enzyme [Alphaproteobacteria bacterium]